MSIPLGWGWDVLFYVFYDIMKIFTLEIVNCYKVEILIVLHRFLNSLIVLKCQQICNIFETINTEINTIYLPFFTL